MISDVRNMDCLEFLKGYDGAPIDLVCTDPPYSLPSWDGGKFFQTETRQKWIADMNVSNLSESYDIAGFAELLDKAQNGNINAYFFCNKLQIPEYFRVYVEKFGCKFDILCWHKSNPLPTCNGKYLTDTEYILYFRNCGKCHPAGYEDARTYFLGEVNVADKKKWGHPTIKPLNMVRTLIRNSSEPGELVFDGFLGSGTTRVACAIEGRDFIGCELDERFYEIQDKRYKAECLGIEEINGHTITQQSLF